MTASTYQKKNSDYCETINRLERFPQILFIFFVVVCEIFVTELLTQIDKL